MKILIRGAGDLATGIAVRLYQCGHQVVMTEIQEPLTVRRQVAFSRAVYEKDIWVESIRGILAETSKEVEQVIADGNVAVIVDEKAAIRESYQPDVMIDAILAKKNLGTSITDAPFVIGVGPGFTAGEDCHCVIETKRGHTLGRVIWEGCPIPNTGVPGDVGGYTLERLLRASADGIMEPVNHIGDYVECGQTVAYTGGVPVPALMSGIIRGMLQPDVQVTKGLKIGDIDARCEKFHCFTVSDKALSIGGAALEAVSQFEKIKNQYGIVVLAAGAATRFGANKLLAQVREEPIYQHMLNKLDSMRMCERVIVTGYDEIERKATESHVTVAKNICPEEGITRSLKMGIEKCVEQNPDIKGILFTVCDQPNLKLSTMIELLKQAMLHPGKIICASHEGMTGNPVLWDRQYFAELMELSGDVGGKSIMDKYRDQIITVETSSLELQDIDTREDLEK